MGLSFAELRSLSVPRGKMGTLNAIWIKYSLQTLLNKPTHVRCLTQGLAILGFGNLPGAMHSVNHWKNKQTNKNQAGTRLCAAHIDECACHPPHTANDSQARPSQRGCVKGEHRELENTETE